MKALFASIHFIGLYAWEVLKGGFRIALDVSTPGLRTSPGFIRVEVPPLSPVQRLLLANLVSMTPGSLSVDYLENDSVLLIHLLYTETDSEPIRTTIRDRFLPAVQSLPHSSKS